MSGAKGIEYMGGKLQYLEIKNFMRWVATLKRSEPMIFTDIEELRRTVPAEYDFSHNTAFAP